MSQNLKDKLAAFLALGIAPEAEALVTALVEEMEMLGNAWELNAAKSTNVEQSVASVQERTETHARFIENLGEAGSKMESTVGALTERVVAVERFAQPLLGVVEPEQTPPAQ